MSFIHKVRVGFFGTPEEQHPGRELGWEECLEWMRKYNEKAEPSLRLVLDPDARGTVERGRALAHFEGYTIGLKKGVLSCPTLATHYILGSINFVVFLHQAIGCSIYSDDEGRFLTLDEFVPKRSFSAEFREMLALDPEFGEGEGKQE